MKHENLAPPETGELILLRLPRVKVRTGISRTEIYRRIALGEFPPPVKLGGARAVAWSSREIDGWIADRIRVRDAANTAKRDKLQAMRDKLSATREIKPPTTRG